MLIWFIFFDEKKDGGAGNSIACFGSSITCRAIWERAKRRAPTVWKSATFFGNGRCELSAILEGLGEELSCKFWPGKVETHRQFQQYLSDVTSVDLSLSLSLTEGTSPTVYQAEALGIIIVQIELQNGGREFGTRESVNALPIWHRVAEREAWVWAREVWTHRQF